MFCYIYILCPHSKILSFIKQLKLILIFKNLLECERSHDIYLADSCFWDLNACVMSSKEILLAGLKFQVMLNLHLCNLFWGKEPVLMFLKGCNIIYFSLRHLYFQKSFYCPSAMPRHSCGSDKINWWRGIPHLVKTKNNVLITWGTSFLKMTIWACWGRYTIMWVRGNKSQRKILAGRQYSRGCGLNYMAVIMDMEEKSMRLIPHVSVHAS